MNPFIYENLGFTGWILCLTFMIWAITATSMIETSIATNTTTVASALVSVTNESITKKPSIFESVCVKVEVLEEIQPTVSLEARFQIFHTMTAEALFTVMCDLIRSFSIFPGNLLILNSKSTKTNSVGHHDISFHTESGLLWWNLVPNIMKTIEHENNWTYPRQVMVNYPDTRIGKSNIKNNKTEYLAWDNRRPSLNSEFYQACFWRVAAERCKNTFIFRYFIV